MTRRTEMALKFRLMVRGFEGVWKDDKKNGKGVYIWPDGRRYEGQWRDDKQDEKGVYIWSDGRQYEGDLKADMKHGNGVENLNQRRTVRRTNGRMTRRTEKVFSDHDGGRSIRGRLE